MKHLTHELLSHMSEHQRDAEATVLNELTTYRGTLSNIIEQSTTQLFVLQQQRDLKVSRGAQAMELMMLEQSVAEHQQHIHEMTYEMSVLDEAIIQQKKKWSVHHKKHKSHEKLNEQIKRKAEKLVSYKTQMAQDDQFAATMVNNRQVSSL